MKLRLSSLLLVVLLVAAPTLALAANPHFIFADGSVDKDGALVVKFKEAGLGDNQLIDYTLTADATATWGCFNRGGNHPQAANKETLAGPVSGSGTFASGKNGQITASLTVGPLEMPVDFECPSHNMVLRLMEVTYTNIVLTDVTTPEVILVDDVSKVFIEG